MQRDDDERPLQRTITASGVLPMPAAPELGRGGVLGRYLVLEPRGSGGMGVVYVAYDPQLDRKIAIKVLKPDAVADQSRLRREGQAMARLQHPNVVTVFDVGVFEDRIFVAMELVEGTTLSGWLEQRQRSWRETVDVFLQAARGLIAAHAVNLVHRDFKPSNVLVGSDGRVRVGDFGLARAVGNAEVVAPLDELSAPSSAPFLQETITHAGTLLGTPGYMSPEQLRGLPADARSDQFSFCVALYRALWGERPFAGDDLATIASEVVAGRLRPPPKDSPVPAWVRDVVLRGLATDPTERWPSMETLLEALGRDPARVRNRWLAVAAAAVALVGGVVGVRVAVRHDSNVCHGAERRFAAAWNGARQDKMRDAFLATKKPYAAQVSDGVARALAAYGAGWAGAETDACEATRVRREQSEELLNLRMECLGQRLREVEAVVDLLEHADDKIVEKAAQMTSALPGVASCSDLAALRAPVRPPADATTRARVDDVRRQIARAKALTDAAKFKEGLAIATPAVAAARAIGYRPLEGEALAQLGAVQYWSGDNAAARTLEDAALAARAGRDFHTEASAWTLGIYVWFAKAQFEVAHTWGRYAFAALEAISGGDDRLRADLLSNLGSVYDREGDYATALDYNTRVLALREKVYPADDPNVAVAHEKLGHTLQNLGRHDEAEQHIRRAVALLEARLGPAHPKVGTALFNVALVQVSERRYQEALATYRRVLPIYENALGPAHANVGNVLLNLGDVEQELGDYEQALAYEQRALAVLLKARGPEHSDYANGLTNIGDVLRMQKKYDDAATYYARATAIYEKVLGTSHRYVAISLIGSAMCAIGAGHPTHALPLVERAIAICEANPGGQSNINEARFVLARALWDSGRDRARARQEAARARSGYAAEKQNDKQVAEIDAWLAAR